MCLGEQNEAGISGGFEKDKRFMIYITFFFNIIDSYIYMYMYVCIYIYMYMYTLFIYYYKPYVASILGFVRFSDETIVEGWSQQKYGTV